MDRPLEINEELNDYTMKLLSMYLDFPENEPITAVDFRCRDGKLLHKLTEKHKGEKYLFGVDENRYNVMNAKDYYEFYKVFQSDYKAEGKMSKDAFSLAVIDPKIKNILVNELFESVDQFIEPDFEKRVRDMIEKQEKYKDQLDLAADDLSEEEKQKQDEKFQRKLEEGIKQARRAYRMALREQEKRLALNRDDKWLLARATDRLMPGGVLVFITAKELIDTEVTIKLCNQYKDIQIIRLEEEEYEEKRKCIILARKRNTNANDNRSGYLLAETKIKSYKDLEEISPQVEPSFKIPSQSLDAVDMFRVGPITPMEALQMVKRSTLLEHYQENYSQLTTSTEPVAPTALHDGHIMLLLTSGYLNGYIGEGEDRHLVKGSATKLARNEQERDDEGNTTVKEKEYYHISVKYLTRDGEFHKLM